MREKRARLSEPRTHDRTMYDAHGELIMIQSVLQVDKRKDIIIVFDSQNT